MDQLPADQHDKLTTAIRAQGVPASVVADVIGKMLSADRETIVATLDARGQPTPATRRAYREWQTARRERVRAALPPASPTPDT